MRSVLIIAFAGLFTGGVGQDVGVEKVHLEPLGLRMILPRAVKISILNDRVNLDFNPKGRQIRQCSLAFAHVDSATEFAHVVQLSKETTLHYNIERYEGGSGGEEHTLVGLVLTPSASYAIQSHDQAEFPAKPEPQFCLEYLSSLEYTQEEDDDN